MRIDLMIDDMPQVAMAWFAEGVMTCLVFRSGWL
jgi:hypothetical protein